MNVLRRNGLTPLTKMFALVVVLAATFALLTPAPAMACAEEETWTTFYCEPQKINACGECYRPCFGWWSCWGCRTDYSTTVNYSCGECIP